MGKGAAKVEVTEYYMSQHFGICLGADALLGLTVKEKSAWTGEQTVLGAIDLNLPELFGGLKKEGGIGGTMHYLPGKFDQVLPDALAVKLGRTNGADCPGYRGIASLFFVGSTQPGFYWTANTPYLPGVWATVRRMPIGPGGGGPTGVGAVEDYSDGPNELFDDGDSPGYFFYPDLVSPLGTYGAPKNVVNDSIYLFDYPNRSLEYVIDIHTTTFSGQSGFGAYAVDEDGSVWGGASDTADDANFVLAEVPKDTQLPVARATWSDDDGLSNGNEIRDVWTFEMPGGATWVIVKPAGSGSLRDTHLFHLHIKGGSSTMTTYDTRDTGETDFNPWWFFQDDNGDLWVAGTPYTASPATITECFFWRFTDVTGDSLYPEFQTVTGLPGINTGFTQNMTHPEGYFFDGAFVGLWVGKTGMGTLNVSHYLMNVPLDGLDNPTAVDITNDYFWHQQQQQANQTPIFIQRATSDNRIIQQFDPATLAFSTLYDLDDWGARYIFSDLGGDAPDTCENAVYIPSISAFVGNGFYYSEAHSDPNGQVEARLRLYLLESGVCAIGPDANPACIIYECLTNTEWGMGSPAAAIDVESFFSAENALLAEEFGLSMIWTRQAEIQAFVQEVLDHIQAVLFVDPSTGLLTLKLIRGDYDPDDLPVLSPDNADLTSFGRKLWGDIVNEINVTWTNPENEQEETVTVQDNASIATQGGTVSDSRNFYGVRNAALAQKLGWRELRSAGQPLASCEAEVDRSQWRLRPASVVKLTWPEYGLSELIMRVTSVDYGKPGDPTIKLALVEDVFGLDIGDYEAPPSTAWEDPSSPPAPIETVEIITLPLFFAAHSTVDIEGAEYPEVLAGVLATTENEDTFAYDLWGEVTLPNGSSEWQRLTTNNIIGRGVLVGALDAEATTTGVSFDDVTGQTAPTVGGFVLIGDDGETGNEIAMVEAVSGTITLTRGVLDTVPRAWPANTPAWFVDGATLLEDPTVRASGETVEYKLLSRTSQGLLALADADLESESLTDRPWQPNRPADVEAYGEAWSSASAPIDATARPDPWVTVTWATRNRLSEDSQVLAWTDATVTPETGQTTRIEVLAFDGSPLATHDALSGTTFDVPDASFGSESIVRLQVYADRSDDDGDFASLQFFEHWVQVGSLTADTTELTADNTFFTADET